jgi:phenylpyruvate tautomerase PptA (4-oxalocrotonate tautomerase family)
VADTSAPTGDRRKIGISLPIVRIEMLQGRAPKVKNELIAPEQVRVLLYELSPEHWVVVGGQTKATQLSAFAKQQNEVDE